MRSRPTVALLEDGPLAGRSVFCDEAPWRLRVPLQIEYSKASVDGVPYSGMAYYDAVRDPNGYPSRDDEGRVHYRWVRREPTQQGDGE